jgi:serine/threonine protein kinase
MTISAGQQLGPYQVQEQIGKGGMATVYKAYHGRLDRYVAIKVIHPAYKDDPGFTSRFEREAQIVAKLEHPGIVPVYDYAEEGDQPYLVMKYIEGQTLRRQLSGGPLPLEEISRIIGAVAQALTYAHKQGVLHRDIKPSNIILTKDGTPYLTDFGLARIAQAGESTMSADMILGTPQYISPEQARGERNLDARTDIYSLGIILYEMVVGRVPFSADTPYAIVHSHIYTAPPRPSAVNPEIPPAVEQVLLKALAKDPAERYQSAVEMMQEFQEALTASGLHALNPQRDQVAADSLSRYQPVLVADGQTISKPLEPAIPSPLPPPVAPAPPEPPRAKPITVDVPNRRVDVVGTKDGRKVEAHIDLSNLQGLGKLGKTIEEQIERNAPKLEELGKRIEKWGEQFEDGDGERKPITVRVGGPPPPPDPEETIRRRVEKRIKKREELRQHVFSYITVNLMLWGIWAFTNGFPANFNFNDGMPWPLWVTMGWGIGLIANFAEYYNKHGKGAARREAEIQAEIDRVREESLVYEKPKREDRLRLTDDGELEPVPEDEISRAAKRKRS